MYIPAYAAMARSQLIMRILPIIALLCYGLAAPAALAQQRPGASGVLLVTDWPEGHNAGQVSSDAERYEILPYVDTLKVGYRFEQLDGRPVAALAVEWKPGRYGILDGRRVPYDQLPDSVYLAAASLVADIYVNGREAAQINLRLDSMQLGPYPGVHAPEPYVLAWDNLFEGVSAQQARTWLEQGFELRNPEIVAITFETYGGERSTYTPDEPVAVGRRRPSRRSVIIVDRTTSVWVDLTWLIRGRSGRGVDNDNDAPDAPDEPRGGQVGRDNSGEDRASRPSSGRTSRSGDAADTGNESADGRSPQAAEEDEADTGSRTARRNTSNDASEEEEDDDDEEKLLPAALTAAVAVGVVAYAGGTVGYFGSPKHAPFGVTAGLVNPSSGFLMQAGVNEAVLGGQGPEHLLAKLFAFHEVLPIPIQPAVGVGALVIHENDAFSYQASVSLGAVGNFGPALFFGAYDVTLESWELGAAFNFRSLNRGADLP
jgi:hypothetical protein